MRIFYIVFLAYADAVKHNHILSLMLQSWQFYCSRSICNVWSTTLKSSPFIECILVVYVKCCACLWLKPFILFYENGGDFIKWY